MAIFWVSISSLTSNRAVDFASVRKLELMTCKKIPRDQITHLFKLVGSQVELKIRKRKFTDFVELKEAGFGLFLCKQTLKIYDIADINYEKIVTV